jgi:translocation and assembly module TamB
MCETWLKYITPLLADATRAEGTFSIALDNAQVPLPDSTRTAAKGVLTIHRGQVGPGPLAQELLGAAQQVRAIIDGSAAARGNQATDLVGAARAAGAFRSAARPRASPGIDRDGRRHGLRTSGSVGFDQTLALVAEVPIQDRWIANKRLLQGLKGTTLQLPIQGSFTQPKTDQRTLADLNQQVIRSAAGGAIEQELGRGLQQLFGPRP